MDYSPIIVMPAHNEADRLKVALEQWTEHCSDVPLFLVLDRCVDHSLDVAQSFRDHNPLLHIIVSEFNQTGKVGAVLQGLWHAMTTPYGSLSRPVVLWDADAEYQMESLPLMLAAFQDAISGLQGDLTPHIMVTGRRDGTWLWRSQIANRLVRATLAFKTGRHPPFDALSGSRILFMRDLLIATQFSRGFTLEMHIVRYMLEHNAIILEQPVSYFPRIEGKHISAWDLPRILWAGIS